MVRQGTLNPPSVGSNPTTPTIYFEKPSSEKKGVLKNMDVIVGFETVATLTTKESGKSQLNLAF